MSSLDPDIKARMLIATNMGLDVELSWFNGFDTSEKALPNANMGFWGDTTGLFDNAHSVGCDVGYAVIPDDVAFDYSAVEGIANMFQICGDLSFSTIKLYADDYYHQVVLIAHELGHLLGLYHDGPMNAVYEPLSALYPQDIQKLRNVCGAEGSGCTDDAGLCIMNTVPTGGTGYPRSFSECSKQYFKMFKHLAGDFPAIYNSACFMRDITASNP